MLVLDANVLIRAILGKRVRHLLEKYAARGVRFYAPEAAFADAEKYLPALLSNGENRPWTCPQPSPTCGR